MPRAETKKENQKGWVCSCFFSLDVVYELSLVERWHKQCQPWRLTIFHIADWSLVFYVTPELGMEKPPGMALSHLTWSPCALAARWAAPLWGGRARCVGALNFCKALMVCQDCRSVPTLLSWGYWRDELMHKECVVTSSDILFFIVFTLYWLLAGFFPFRWVKILVEPPCSAVHFAAGSAAGVSVGGKFPSVRAGECRARRSARPGAAQGAEPGLPEMPTGSGRAQMLKTLPKGHPTHLAVQFRRSLIWIPLRWCRLWVEQQAINDLTEECWVWPREWIPGNSRCIFVVV